MIGQSNMAGRGKINEVEPIKNDKIKVLKNGRWQSMFSPVNPDRVTSGISLAESFADEYVKEHNVEVGLIPCADGGTSLSQWREGGLLFDHAVFQAKLALRTSEIVGVLWHQGEVDCHESLYPLYENKFTNIMNAFRRELNLYDVPFVLGGLGDFLKDCKFDDTLKNYFHINDALRKIARKNRMTGFVSAQGLTSNPDNLHFNAQSLREFGIRYYKEFSKLELKDRTFENRDLINEERSEMELL